MTPLRVEWDNPSTMRDGPVDDVPVASSGGGAAIGAEKEEAGSGGTRGGGPRCGPPTGDRRRRPPPLRRASSSLSFIRVDREESPLPVFDNETVGTVATAGTAGSSSPSNMCILEYMVQLREDALMRGGKRQQAGGERTAEAEEAGRYKDICERLSAELAEMTRRLSERQSEIDERQRRKEEAPYDDAPDRRMRTQRRGSGMLEKLAAPILARLTPQNSERRIAQASSEPSEATAPEIDAGAVEDLRLEVSRASCENEARDVEIESLSVLRDNLEVDLGRAREEQCEWTMSSVRDVEEEEALRRSIERTAEEVAALRGDIEEGYREMERLRRQLLEAEDAVVPPRDGNEEEEGGGDERGRRRATQRSDRHFGW